MWSYLTCTGRFGFLIVIVRIYEPKVTCRALPGRPANLALMSCQNVIADLPVDTTTRTFGQQGAQGVQVTIPKMYEAGQ